MSYIIYKDMPTEIPDHKVRVYYTGNGEFSYNQDEAKKFDKWIDIIKMILQIALSILSMSNLKYKKI